MEKSPQEGDLTLVVTPGELESLRELAGVAAIVAGTKTGSTSGMTPVSVKLWETERKAAAEGAKALNFVLARAKVEPLSFARVVPPEGTSDRLAGIYGRLDERIDQLGLADPEINLLLTELGEVIETLPIDTDQEGDMLTEPPADQ